VSWHVDRMALQTTGNVNPVEEWTEGPDGRRIRTGEQATDKNRVLLWEVEVQRDVEEFGKSKREVVTIRVSSDTEPKVRDGQMTTFKHVEINARNGDRGNVRWFLNASGTDTGTASTEQK